MINFIVDGLNKISFDVPNWVPWIGGKKFGFNIPRANLGRLSIPRLAQGAVIPPNSEFLAVLGDQKRGTNIEAPLDTIVEAFRQANAEQFGGNVTFVAELDGEVIFRKVVQMNKKNTRLTGQNALAY